MPTTQAQHHNLPEAALLLEQGRQLGPGALSNAREMFETALSLGEVRAHLGLAWLALWEDAPDIALTHLRGFFTANRSPSVRADELLVLALRAVCRSGLDLPQDLRELVIKYVLHVSFAMEFLNAQGPAGAEVRAWLMGGAPGDSMPAIAAGRNFVLLLTAALSLSGAVWLLIFDGPTWILAAMPAVFLVTGYNRVMNRRGVAARRFAVVAWRQRRATDLTEW